MLIIQLSTWEPNSKRKTMKLLLVMSSDETYNLISVYIKPLGFEFIRYHHIVKAMDNIDEVDPTGIVISARDFPRHWKTMVQFVRNERPKDICPIILLTGNNFPLEESSKASFLGVSGTVVEDLHDSAVVDRIQGILNRFLRTDEKRRSKRYQVEPWQRFNFVFSRPGDNALITGELQTISTGGLSFLPHNPPLMKEIFVNTKLEDCSFRAGNSILSPACRLARTGRIISMEFLSFPEGEQETLNSYLDNLPLKELERIENPEAKR